MMRNADNKLESLTFESYKNKLKRDLIRHMGGNRMEPEENIIYDGTTQYYDAYIEGKPKKAYYVATCNLFGNREPLLVCHYGLIEQGHEYIYSSAITEKCNNCKNNI